MTSLLNGDGDDTAVPTTSLHVGGVDPQIGPIAFERPVEEGRPCRRSLGARIGITAVLHTWGSALTHHPHLHIIVPGGGLAPDGGRWISCRPGVFLPVRVLAKLFRRRMLERLAAAHAAGLAVGYGRAAGRSGSLLRPAGSFPGGLRTPADVPPPASPPAGIHNPSQKRNRSKGGMRRFMTDVGIPIPALPLLVRRSQPNMHAPAPIDAPSDTMITHCRTRNDTGLRAGRSSSFQVSQALSSHAKCN